MGNGLIANLVQSTVTNGSASNGYDDISFKTKNFTSSLEKRQPSVPLPRSTSYLQENDGKQKREDEAEVFLRAGERMLASKVVAAHSACRDQVGDKRVGRIKPRINRTRRFIAHEDLSHTKIIAQKRRPHNTPNIIP